MISKQNGEGQTECFGCKKKGRFGLNWDSFLYNYNNEAYCLECLIEELEKLTKEKQELIYYLKEGICFLEEKIFEKSSTENSFTLALFKNKLTTYKEILSRIEKK